MLEFDDFIFAAPKYTFADRFQDVCHLIDLPFLVVGESYYDIPETYSQKLYVTMVRHPYTWLKKFYHSPQHVTGTSPYAELYSFIRDGQGFPGFIRLCSIHAGVVSGIFNRYKASVVLRSEDIPWNFVGFFESYGMDEKKLHKLHGLKFGELSRHIAIDANTEQELQAMIVRSESDFCSRYNYD